MATFRRARRWLGSFVSLVAGLFVSMPGNAAAPTSNQAGTTGGTDLKVDSPSLSQTKKTAQTGTGAPTLNKPPSTFTWSPASPISSDAKAPTTRSTTKAPPTTELRSSGSPTETKQPSTNEWNARSSTQSQGTPSEESEQIIFQNYVIQQLQQIDERLKKIEERLGGQK